MTTANQTAQNSVSALTETEQTRINHGVLLQALREVIHAANAEVPLPPTRVTEIRALLVSDTAKDAELLRALRELFAHADRTANVSEARGEQIYNLANAYLPIEDMLCNDEDSSDEELIDHLVKCFGMRRIEAVEHVKRRDYLQRYLMPTASRHAAKKAA